MFVITLNNVITLASHGLVSKGCNNAKVLRTGCYIIADGRYHSICSALSTLL